MSLQRSAAGEDDKEEEMNVPSRSQRQRKAASYAEDDEDDEDEGAAAKKRKSAHTSSGASSSSGKPHAKRSAADDDNDAEEYSGGGGSSSSSAKRARKASVPVPRADSDDDEDDGDDPDGDDDDTGVMRGKSENYEAGQLLNIKVTDFMCHGSLSLDFGGHVNFITGDNGSGKSAIVAALQLCLGARADNTGRGRNLAGFIREGSDGPAVVRVTLRNTGSDAFKADKYGDRIQIERKIGKQGSAGYRLLDNNGKLVSNQVSELRALQRQFNLYMENPCCVLTQEESKKFIQGQEKDKYAFFLKATGLEQTLVELTESSSNLDEADKEIAKGLERLTGKQEAVNTLKQELVDLMALDKYDGMISDCLAKSFWCDVYHIKTVCDEFEHHLDEARIARDDHRAVLERVLSDDAKGGNMEELSSAVEELGEQMAEVDDDLTKKKASVRELQKKLHEASRNLKVKAQDKVEMEDMLARTRHEIKTMRGRALENAGEKERELLQKIDACTRAIADEETKADSVRQERTRLTNELQELEEQSRNWSHQAHDADSEITRLTRELQRARSGDAKERRIEGFGYKIREVMHEISRTGFREPVRGPMGMSVKMKDGQGKWSKAAEKSLGRCLSAFVVTNAEDQRTLNGIFRRLDVAGQHRAIFQTKNPRFDVRRVDGALMMNDVVTIDDDQVFNCIIDQHRIEQVLLVENEQDCSRYVNHAGFKDRRIQKAISVEATEYTYNAHGNMKHGVYRGGFK